MDIILNDIQDWIEHRQTPLTEFWGFPTHLPLRWCPNYISLCSNVDIWLPPSLVLFNVVCNGLIYISRPLNIILAMTSKEFFYLPPLQVFCPIFRAIVKGSKVFLLLLIGGKTTCGVRSSQRVDNFRAKGQVSVNKMFDTGCNFHWPQISRILHVLMYIFTTHGTDENVPR